MSKVSASAVFNKPAILDGDFFAFRASSAVQKDINWGDGLFTCHAYLNDAIDQFEVLLNQIKTSIHPNTFVIALSSEHNFRKDVDPEYKGNRKNTRKPTCYQGLIEYIKKNYPYDEQYGFEADDLMGIYCAVKGYTIVSADKDMKTIPGYFYNFLDDSLYHFDKKEAFTNLMIQVITGDRADNYSGVPGYGKVKATRFIEGLYKDNPDINEFEVMNKVGDLYLEKTGDDKNFTRMLTLAKICSDMPYMHSIMEEYKLLYTNDKQI